MTFPAEPNTPFSRKNIMAFLCITVLAAVVYFAGLGSYPLLDPDEGRYAEIPREMLESGDFITPRLNYVKYFEKPPLFYWLTAGSMALFGQKEWAVRLVPALAGFLTFLLVMGFGKRLFNGRTGVMAAWIYLTGMIPLILARMPIIDGVFSLFLTAAWGTWHLGYQSPGKRFRQGWYCISWACLGMAVMTKGIAAIALTGLIVGGIIICRRDWRALGAMAWAPGLLIFAIIVVPWHWAVSLRNPEFFHFYIVVQHFSRLVSLEHAKPFWFFIVLFPFGMLFWTGLFFPAAANSIKTAWRVVRDPQNKGTQSESILFLVIWVSAVIGLFSLSRCKLVPYILPAYPAMALLIAVYLDKGALLKCPARWCTALMAFLLLAAVLPIRNIARGQDMIPMAELTLPLVMAQIALLSGGILLLVSLFKRRLIPFATGFTLILLMPAMFMIVPVPAKYRKIGGFIKAMPQPLPREIRVAEWRNYDQALSFYSRRRTILIDEINELAFGKSLGDHSEYFLKGEESLKRLALDVPLLVNIRPRDWPTVRTWQTLKPVAANSTNVMVGNNAFFCLTGLKPWSDAAVTPPPLLLMPRRRD